MRQTKLPDPCDARVFIFRIHVIPRKVHRNRKNRSWRGSLVRNFCWNCVRTERDLVSMKTHSAVLTVSPGKQMDDYWSNSACNSSVDYLQKTVCFSKISLRNENHNLRYKDRPMLFHSLKTLDFYKNLFDFLGFPKSVLTSTCFWIPKRENLNGFDFASPKVFFGNRRVCGYGKTPKDG